MLVYRMHGLSYDAFDTTGASLQPGRWHPAGVRVIYAAEHVSLAVLETLIHAGGKKIPPRALTSIRIPDDLLIENASWMDFPESQLFGEAWVREQRSAVLRVPSIAVNKLESNFVFNPRHPDFAKIERGASAPFEFNPRFFAL